MRWLAALDVVTEDYMFRECANMASNPFEYDLSAVPPGYVWSWRRGLLLWPQRWRQWRCGWRVVQPRRVVAGCVLMQRRGSLGDATEDLNETLWIYCGGNRVKIPRQ